MKLTLYRDGLEKNHTRGKLLVDGVFCCYTVEAPLAAKKLDGERHYSDNGNWSTGSDRNTAIPAGEYKVEFRHMPQLNREAPYVVNVESKHGFKSVAMMPGSYTNAVLFGRISLGLTRTEFGIGFGRSAFDKVVDKIASAHIGEQVTITVVQSGADGVP